MKLYTEEQVRMLDINCGNSTLDEVIGCLTPIEIPSDEEMRKIAKRICNGHQHAKRYNQMLICCFNMGKSVIEKIQGGNK